VRSSVSALKTGLRRVGSARFRGALLAATAVLTLASLATSQAGTDERSLRLVNEHTGEKLTVVFKRNGAYVPEGLKQLNHILRDWRLDRETNMDPKLFDVLYDVVRESGATEPIHIICGYRAPDTNEYLRKRTSGVAKNSQHINGKAMDFFIPGVPLAKLREIGLRLQEGGVGFYPTSGSPFVHMDTGSVRHWPGMTREQLVKIFPNGHTLHIPSDGKPLPGYAEALAEYKAKGSVTSTMVASNDGAVAAPARSSRMATIVPPKPEPKPTVVAASTVGVPVPRPAPDRMKGRIEADAPIAVAAVIPASEPAVSGETTAVIRKDQARVPMMAYASATGGDRFDPFKILTTPDRAPVTTVASRPTEPAAPPPPVQRTVRAVAPYADVLARFSRPATLAETIPFWTGDASLRQMDFASLVTTPARAMAAFMVKPQVSYGQSFSGEVYAGLRTDSFSGALVRPMAVIDLRAPAAVASR
jgi:uncharacterized protein YcbK (DUF882 family)